MDYFRQGDSCGDCGWGGIFCGFEGFELVIRKQHVWKRAPGSNYRHLRDVISRTLDEFVRIQFFLTLQGHVKVQARLRLRKVFPHLVCVCVCSNTVDKRLMVIWICSICICLCFDGNMKMCVSKIRHNTLCKGMTIIFIEEQETQIVRRGQQ